jgi:hypothetical protein
MMPRYVGRRLEGRILYQFPYENGKIPRGHRGDNPAVSKDEVMK